ncbi:MAG: hypothetical protein COU09_01130 [Candidatus Harrisonbacteria bacterium CG10_big_fil_rev_8_21_14_0_10_44_23]|uniref:Uncharacterized protein n=1 Tax=Candidatus Harrisonbacteria bacterium CG10_big_fil_rev_8_21_14_0_10_44_23 TaxID=1974585 RepID=A0A2H0USP0_9BACT|nr:MAG: hypothetical protein COU09_01130 [Candidatus Harrisonbacteria bacterium CG10_big_fil_rev_8_21_14_0_10_44_23]
MEKGKFIILTIVIIVFAGIALGLLYSRLPGNNPQESQAGCESVGGDWDLATNRCLASYKPAGELCTDGGQCKSGVCFPPALTEEQTLDLANGPLKNIAGTCYPDELITGCVEQVLMGTISKESMCLD